MIYEWGNSMNFQENREGLRALPLKSGECVNFCSDATHGATPGVTHMATTVFTSVGNSADSPKELSQNKFSNFTFPMTCYIFGSIV
jgi:hypothetical protein